NERGSVSFQFDLVGDLDVSNIAQRVSKWLKRINEIAAAAELELAHGALAVVEDNLREMILDFGGVLVQGRQRSEQTLFLPGEKHEPERTARANTPFDNGIRGGE